MFLVTLGLSAQPQALKRKGLLVHAGPEQHQTSFLHSNDHESHHAMCVNTDNHPIALNADRTTLPEITPNDLYPHQI